MVNKIVKRNERVVIGRCGLIWNFQFSEIEDESISWKHLEKAGPALQKTCILKAFWNIMKKEAGSPQDLIDIENLKLLL